MFVGFQGHCCFLAVFTNTMPCDQYVVLETHGMTDLKCLTSVTTRCVFVDFFFSCVTNKP